MPLGCGPVWWQETHSAVRVSVYRSPSPPALVFGTVTWQYRHFFW